MSNVKKVFNLLMIAFFVVLAQLFTPVSDILSGPVFLLPMIIFSILGAVLIYVTIKERVGGKLRKYLLLTGITSVGFFVCAVLHNLVYGLFIVMFGEGFWNGGDEPVFFIVAILIIPILFVIGAIKSWSILRR